MSTTYPELDVTDPQEPDYQKELDNDPAYQEFIKKQTLEWLALYDIEKQEEEDDRANSNR